MEAIRKETLSFLKELKKNNDREWFNLHRKEYEAAKHGFETFITEVIERVIKFDPILKGLEANQCIFRINRDTRFSNDKSPYKTNFGAFIVRGGRKNGDKFAGYYIHVEPGSSMIAGGAYMPPSPWLSAIRENISDNPAEFKKIISAKPFKEHFGELSGEKLKTAPKGYPSDHPLIELLKHKSFLAMKEISDPEVTKHDYQDKVIEVLKAMKPLNDFLTSY